MKTVGKVARSGLGLTIAFGKPEQKAQTARLEQVAQIVQGAGHAGAKIGIQTAKDDDLSPFINNDVLI